MSDKERLKELRSKLRDKGLKYLEFDELCKLTRKRDDNKYAAANYWEM